jgi:hypothetical protein
MKKINENSSALGQFQNRDSMRGLPFYGQKGDFNFVMGRSQFTPGISIKSLPLSDMSRNADVGISEFDHNVNLIRHYFKPGDRVRGVLVNSQIKSKNGKMVVGKLKRISVNRRDHTIKAYIKDPETLKEQEIYIDTMERLYESNKFALSFDQFVLNEDFNKSKNVPK